MKKQVSEDSVSEPPLGKRDIIQLIKYRASATPNASYGAIARDENDMSKGFEEISWSRFNNAIGKNLENEATSDFDNDPSRSSNTLAAQSPT